MKLDQPSSSAISYLRVHRLTKYYGTVAAVQGVDLDVQSGEFLTLLGPSGCGKTTTLMVIAGFESASAGDVLVDGSSVIGKPPHKRGIGVVFQNAALFPHMSVKDNIAFPLRMRGMKETEIQKQVHATLELVKLPGFEHRFPNELSGGQKQRVGIARALVFNPKLILMDEPLSALDRKLREHMQLELKRLQKQLKATVVYVTHDQEEAILLSDRIALMNAGKIEQIGSPRDLYERPTSYFAANFLGECNFLQGEVLESTGQKTLVRTDAGTILRMDGSTKTQGSRTTVAVRPERVHILRSDSEQLTNSFEGSVDEVIYAGDFLRVQVTLDTGDRVLIKSRETLDIEGVANGLRVRVGWDNHHTRFL